MKTSENSVRWRCDRHVHCAGFRVKITYHIEQCKLNLLLRRSSRLGCRSIIDKSKSSNPSCPRHLVMSKRTITDIEQHQSRKRQDMNSFILHVTIRTVSFVQLEMRRHSAIRRLREALKFHMIAMPIGRESVYPFRLSLLIRNGLCYTKCTFSKTSTDLELY